MTVKLRGVAVEVKFRTAKLILTLNWWVSLGVFEHLELLCFDLYNSKDKYETYTHYHI